MDLLKTEFEFAKRENATNPLPASYFLPFCELAVRNGYGIANVEAWGSPTGKVGRNPIYEILGVDEKGRNWEEHRDPQISLALAREKYNLARRDGADLVYTVFIDKP